MQLSEKLIVPIIPIQEEKKSEHLREKARISMGKEMTKQRAELEEAERKRRLDERRRDKEEEDRAR